MVSPNRWTNKILEKYCLYLQQHFTPARGRKDILPDPINTPGIYPLVFVQNNLTQTNLLVQQHVTGTKPGLYDREPVFKAVDGPSKATQESEKEAEACRNIKKIR